MKPATTPKKTKKASVRLSPHIIPLHYKIHLIPDLENFVFEGEEEITLDIKKSTNVIRLHSAEIEILSAEVFQGKVAQVGQANYKEKDEEVDILFEKNIKPGKVVLKLKFSGILNDKMRGFYRSKYTLEGKEYHMGVTQFESTDARRAFPCFDEPSQKAVFEVSLKIPEDRVAISNMLEETVTKHEGGYKVVQFSKSPKMSSYLLAFIVGHFEAIEDKTNDGVIVRVFVTPGKKKQAEFALNVAVRTLEFYTRYFKIKYPLPSMDLIAIPDFAAGAMENWGAVTYRETALLVDPVDSSTHNKQWVALVIAHELAHQWFGNLVTMEWWTHLWLNEGFASYMEYVAVDDLFPEWNIWTQFVYMDHSHALELDGLKSTHPIEVEVSHPAEISEIFDEVSYSKGASVIRMLAEYLGYKNFRDGLRLYLKTHSYKNASTTDLWKALEKISEKPASKIMQNWTGKPGYPLLEITRIDNKVSVSQKRFFSSVFSQKTKDETIWQVPIDFIFENKKNEKYLLKKKSNIYPFPVIARSETTKQSKSLRWIKINKDETGFVRVKYSPELLAALKAPILSLDTRLSEQDRFGIVRDAFVLSEAGIISTDLALQLSRAYVNDESYIVWADIAGELGKIKNLLFGTESYAVFQEFVLKLFSKIGAEVGWDKKKAEDHSVTLLRSVALGVLGNNGDKDVIKKAHELFELDKTGEKKISSDLRGMVYALICKNGGIKEYNYFLKKYKEETFQEEKDRLLRALCAFKDPKILQQMLDFSFTDEVKAQDSFKVITFIANNPYGRDLAWKKVKVEWDAIAVKFGGGHLFTRFVKPFGNLTSVEEAKEIEIFFKLKDSKGLERTIQQVLEQIKSNAEWKKRDYKKIVTFLKTQQG